MTELYDPPELHEPARAPRVVTIGPLEAVRRHRLLAVLPLILAVAGALTYGLTRTPRYEAEARLSIGRIDLNTPGALSSFVEASQALASGYARAVSSNFVINRVSREVSVPPDILRFRLGAAPIPGSAVFRVVGIGPSADLAIATANAGSSALQAYIERLNTRNPNGSRLLREFKAIGRQAVLLEQRVRRLTAAVERAELTGRGASDAQLRALARARTQSATALLRLSTRRSAYAATQASQSTVSLVQQLTTATFATDDRSEQLQLVLFYALAAGGLIGAALATLRANNQARRAVRR